MPDQLAKATEKLKSRRERRKIAKETGQDFIAISIYRGARDDRWERDGDGVVRLGSKYIRKGHH